MSKGLVSPDVMGRLRSVLVWWKQSPEYQDIVGSREAVLARYHPIFSPDKIASITSEDFLSFLLFRNNHHWDGLHRMGPRMVSDMKALRKTLATVVDEKKPIEGRLDEAINMVRGMGKGIITAVLITAYPQKYGVWNNTSEGGMKQLDIWPSFERGEKFGSRYLKVNEVLLDVSSQLGVDLWELDSIWWAILKHEEEKGQDSVALTVESLSSPESNQCFGLERHLHEFLRDNWERIELNKEWELYTEDGDPEAGYEYPCNVGRIDLLARHKKQRRWLVIELKRNQTSDQTVGQVLRYMGWVKNKLAEKGDKVEGLVIAHEADEAMQYALSSVPDVGLKLYQVEFKLREPENIE